MSANHTTSVRNGTESRALVLLGAGYSPEVVATTVGVSVSRISQLLSDEDFASEVSELRFKSLQKHNIRDDEYDSMEDSLIKQFKQFAPLLTRPMEILKAMKTFNEMKRRGMSAPQEIGNTQTVVNIIMPTKVVQKFTTNINNQVVSAGEQDLITMQSGRMASMAAARSALVLENAIVQLTTRSNGGNSDENVRSGNERTTAGAGS